ncbi:hypothetical protein K437DRAFT_190091 [Tilletiaria anomala UBC 951]|uniref:Uncharacterized protein n=1 Tax=Tilletiaria anomala (strain ATCC 24038 / CBS 436.72 / UBC 951) TaxID=1037660 RepID=A0A066VP84_TILAU|nr:uncharacterized protein K437DRAFT_190091 [Tilletiaria anomala UBC 951]KDN40345.1 hypothetical protein K437DRAFT_190091 [Tilletiaria anomala UBC 951]
MCKTLLAYLPLRQSVYHHLKFEFPSVLVPRPCMPTTRLLSSSTRGKVTWGHLLAGAGKGPGPGGVLGYLVEKLRRRKKRRPSCAALALHNSPTAY